MRTHCTAVQKMSDHATTLSASGVVPVSESRSRSSSTLARRTELDTLVKGDHLVEEAPAKKRDEIAADREEDEDDVDVEDESGGASDHVGRAEDGAGWRGMSVCLTTTMSRATAPLRKLPGRRWANEGELLQETVTGNVRLTVEVILHGTRKTSESQAETRAANGRTLTTPTAKKPSWRSSQTKRTSAEGPVVHTGRRQHG